MVQIARIPGITKGGGGISPFWTETAGPVAGAAIYAAAAPVAGPYVMRAALTKQGKFWLSYLAGLAIGPATAPIPVDNAFQGGPVKRWIIGKSPYYGKLFTTGAVHGGVISAVMLASYGWRHRGDMQRWLDAQDPDSWDVTSGYRKSRGGQDTSRTGKPSARKSMRGLSANDLIDLLDKELYASRSRKRKSGTSFKPGRRKASPRSRGSKERRSRRNSRRPTTWCWRHKKLHWCKYTR